MDAEAGKAPSSDLIHEVGFEIGTIAEVGADLKKVATRIIEIVRAHDAKQKAGE